MSVYAHRPWQSRPPKQEVTMRLITRFELAAKSTTELRSLHKEVFNAMVRSEPRTLERVNALASLENIEIELASRAPSP